MWVKATSHKSTKNKSGNEVRVKRHSERISLQRLHLTHTFGLVSSGDKLNTAGSFPASSMASPRVTFPWKRIWARNWERNSVQKSLNFSRVASSTSSSRSIGVLYRSRRRDRRRILKNQTKFMKRFIEIFPRSLLEFWKTVPTYLNLFSIRSKYEDLLLNWYILTYWGRRVQEIHFCKFSWVQTSQHQISFGYWDRPSRPWLLSHLSELPRIAKAVFHHI